MIQEDKRASIVHLLKNHIRPLQTAARPSIVIYGDVGIAINIEQRPGDKLPIDQIEALIQAYSERQG